MVLPLSDYAGITWNERGIGLKTQQVLALDSATDNPSENYATLLSTSRRRMKAASGKLLYRTSRGDEARQNLMHATRGASGHFQTINLFVR